MTLEIEDIIPPTPSPSPTHEDVEHPPREFCHIEEMGEDHDWYRYLTVYPSVVPSPPHFAPSTLEVEYNPSIDMKIDASLLSDLRKCLEDIHVPDGCHLHAHLVLDLTVKKYDGVAYYDDTCSE